MIIINNLLKLRIKKKLTRPQLSKISGVPVSTINKLEIGVNDMRGAKADTLYKLATALNTTVEHLLEHYLYFPIGKLYEEAELKCIVVLKKEWDSLKWESTDITLLSEYKGEYISTIYDAAIALGYKILAKTNTSDYCFEKDGNIIVLRGPGKVIMAKLPKTLKDIRENDGIICNGSYSSIESYDELPE